MTFLSLGILECEFEKWTEESIDFVRLKAVTRKLTILKYKHHYH